MKWKQSCKVPQSCSYSTYVPHWLSQRRSLVILTFIPFFFFLGEYTCAYTQKSNVGLYTISHKAIGVLEVSLLPNIDINVVPSFPHCQKSSDLLQATVRCEIESSNESYAVTWKGQGITAEITPMTPSKCIFLCSSSLPILFSF